MSTDLTPGAGAEPRPSASPRLGALPPGAVLVEALFAQAPYSVALYDVHGRLAAANGAYERHWGIRVADVPPDYSVLTDAQFQEGGLLDLIHRVYAGEVVTLPPIRYDAARATGANGRAVWTQGHCYPVREGDGTVAYMAVVHTDVTERVDAETALRAAHDESASRAALLQEQGLELELSNQQLQEQAAELEVASDDLARARDAALSERERLDRVITQLPAAVAVYEGPELRFRALSAAYRRIIGGREVVGRPIREALPELSGGDGGTDFFALLDRVYTTGEAVHGTAVPAAWDDNGDGVAEDHMVDLVYAPLRGPGPADAPGAPGPVEGVTALVLDVTARARAESAVRESEARFRNMADAAPVMLWVTEADGACTFLNRAWLDFTGRSLQEGLGFGWLDAVHPDDRPRAERTFREANAQRSAFHADYRLRRHDGVYRWAVDTAAPRLTPGGEYLGYVGSVLDIDERTQLLEAERAARIAAEEARAGAEALRGRAETSETLARQLFALSPLPTWVFDAETLAFLEVNDAALRHYGWTREEFLAMTIRDIRPPEEIPRMLATTQAPHPVGASQGVFRHLTKAGEPLDVELFLRDVEYEGRRATIAVVQDVTERRRAEAALQEAIRAAEAANRAKSEFLAIMSHELRTPLNAIGGYAELLELGVRGPVSDQQRADLARIQQSQRHLLGLINEVLNYARLESGAVQYARADVLVRDAVQEAAELVMPQARAKGLALTVSVGDPTLTVRADPDKLRQVLLNLLSNAVKFTDRGGDVELAYEASPDGPGGAVAAIRVRDAGIGIPADKLAAIFEPFVQVRADLTRPHEGTGLGLAISRDLARGMGGELTVKSAPGAGSTFTVTLPRLLRTSDAA